MQRMKVSEIPYERADAEKVCGVIDKAVEKINPAKAERELHFRAEYGIDEMCEDSWRFAQARYLKNKGEQQ